MRIQKPRARMDSRGVAFSGCPEVEPQILASCFRFLASNENKILVTPRIAVQRSDTRIQPGEISGFESGFFLQEGGTSPPLTPFLILRSVAKFAISPVHQDGGFKLVLDLDLDLDFDLDVDNQIIAMHYK